MKIALALATIASSQDVETGLSADGRRANQEKRYFQLTEMMENYNKNFDERKYWAYGCNCLILGDRPMSDPGLGRPVDELDTVCKAYKDCLKCARWAHGDTCIGEFRKYKFGIRRGEVTCRSDEGTCEAALCECDRAFAKAHEAATSVFTDDYHLFWSQTGWEPESQCTRGSNGNSDPQCCGATKKKQPYVLYNANKKECCADGSVQPTGMC